jgi:hypothetical protein
VPRGVYVRATPRDPKPPIAKYVDVQFTARGPRSLDSFRGVPARARKVTVEPYGSNKGATILLKNGEEIARLSRAPGNLERVGLTKDFAVDGVPGEKCVITYHQ